MSSHTDTASDDLSLRRRTSLTGGFLKRTPSRSTKASSVHTAASLPTTPSVSSTGPTLDADDSGTVHDSSDEQELQEEDLTLRHKQHYRDPGYRHGYVTQVAWSKELEELQPPKLLLSTPDAMLDFKIAWIDYTEKLEMIIRAKINLPLQRTSQIKTEK